MLPNPLPQLRQLSRRPDPETRVPRRVRLVHARRDVDLLPGVADVEPCQVVFAVRGHGAGGQAQSFAVEGRGEGEGAGGHEEVYVCEAGDHCCW